MAQNPEKVIMYRSQAEAQMDDMINNHPEITVPIIGFVLALLISIAALHHLNQRYRLNRMYENLVGWRWCRRTWGILCFTVCGITAYWTFRLLGYLLMKV